MKLFKYNTVLLLMMFGGLVGAGMAYATPSAPTPGPSVGHRPVVTGLVLGASDAGGIYKGDMTLSSTSLKPGEGIGLFNAAGGPNAMDVDGDLDKAGAHCVWYRVDTNGVETVVQDPGPNDRRCSYTIQSGDVGHKIKNVITIFSDQDSATQKGYTLNPIASMPVETVSANSVTWDLVPLRASLNGKIYAENTWFPTSGFSQATFSLIGMPVTGTTWTSSHANVAVTPGGRVTFNDVVSGPVTIKGESTSGLKAEYTFTLNRWYTGFGQMKLNYADAEAYCQNRGEILPNSKTISRHNPGGMVYEWGNIAYYTGSNIIATPVGTPAEGQWGWFPVNSTTSPGALHLQLGGYTSWFHDKALQETEEKRPRYVMCERTL